MVDPFVIKQSWAISEGIKVYGQPCKETYAFTEVKGGRKKRSILPFIVWVVDQNGSKKVGREKFKQNSPEAEEKYIEIISYFYNRANK